MKPLIKWRNYSQQTFQEAIKENKPIFLLLTAPSWCYWCQVYESEDYLFHSKVYPYLNENFIPIYVDADQRQDLTRKYLEGGWPSTTVMTPDGERLFGFAGPRPVLNIRTNLQKAVRYVTPQNFSLEVNYSYKNPSPVIPQETQLQGMINNYLSFTLQVYDSEHGGFGRSQKFPQPRTLDFLLESYEKSNQKEFLLVVKNTLQNQYTKIEEIETNYNLFDPIEGGFHRYGTGRDWSLPHYEKMLDDNARLLKTYSHLLQLTPQDELTQEVVKKTEKFMEEKFYDKEKGGFYGNIDADGEEEYYGKIEREKEKPRIEKTKYTDWNSEAILTYLYLWESSQEKEYREIAEKTLDFFSQEMVTDKGAYHYAKEDDSREVRGSLLDNAYLLLAFTEGYQTLGKEKYLKTAKRIANYTLENLYDWSSGGFFERNSPDENLYAPGEAIDFSKPGEENGIMAYALLQLYQETDNIYFLAAGLKTLGRKLNEVGRLDRGYYLVKAAQLTLNSSLLSEYEKKKGKIEEIEKEKLENFWVKKVLKTKKSRKGKVREEEKELEKNLSASKKSKEKAFVESKRGLNNLKGPLFFLLLVAFFAGLLSFLSPCTLPILPAYLAYTFQSSKKNVKGMTIAFFLGLSVVFSLLGMTATSIGNFLKSNLSLFSQITGLAIILFGFYILLGKGFSGLRINPNKPTSYFGSFVFGAILGLSWTPCIGPILVAILLLASTASSVLSGGLLLFIYALGLGLPLILLSSYLNRVDKNSRIWRMIRGKELRLKIGKKSLGIHSNSLISGVLFIILGYLIFSGILFTLNQYFATTSFQKGLFSLEEKLLEVVR